MKETRRSLSLFSLTALVGAAFFGNGLAIVRAESPAANPSSPASPTEGTVKVDPSPPSVRPLTTFAPVVEKVMPSVVTISTSRVVRPSQQQNRFMDDPMFRRFFGLPEGDDESGNQDEAPRGRVDPKKKGKSMPFGLGSGVVVTKEGHILTNNHVIDQADDIIVTFGKSRKEYKAKKIGVDPDTDLALIKIESTSVEAVTFADSGKVQAGDITLAVGSPFGLSQSVTMGIVSSVGRRTGLANYEDFIQTDASINMGNSGGALFDVDGRLIGINTAIFSRTGGNLGIGFAVPSNLARLVMDSLLKNGRVIRGFLGVMLQDIDEEDASAYKLKDEEGALITGVQSGSPAEKAGLKPYDVITAVEGTKVEGMRQLRLRVSSMTPGTKVNLTYVRGGEEKRLTVELGELKADRVVAKEPEATDPDLLDGVVVADVSDENRKRYNLPADAKGVVVTEVDPDSPSAEAGIAPGDLILDIEREPVTDADQAVELSEKVKKQKRVLIRVSKQGSPRIVTLRSRE